MADDLIASFEERYCPPIDPALLSAILSDFNLSDPLDNLRAAATLDKIKLTAAEEHQSGFDPSGSSSAAIINYPAHDGSDSHFEASSQEADVASAGTEATSISKGCDDGSESFFQHEQLSISADDITYVEQLHEKTKKRLLQEMFPMLSDVAISHSLSKSNGNWSTVLDNLLTIVYFSNPPDGEDKVFNRSVDAFSENHGVRRGRKGHNRKRNTDLIQSTEISPSKSLPTTPPNEKFNAWKSGREDIDFITARTQLSAQKVSSAYHRNGTSLSATIIDLLGPYMMETPSVTSDANMTETNIYELSQEFPTISLSNCVGLIRMTHPSTAAAHELAKAVTSSSSSSSSNQNASSIRIITKYAPVDLSSSDNEWTPAQSRPRPSQKKHKGCGSVDAAALATSYSLAHRAALSQARAMYARGRSSGDNLLSQGAGYYAQVSRDMASKREAAASEAANDLVARQSTAEGTIDLHGVSVKDGVRIAREMIDVWWSRGGKGVIGLDGRRGEGDGGQGFKIVVGMGRHSEGGIGKLGPAVKKVLAQEGWKVEEGMGFLMVTGKKR